MNSAFVSTGKPKVGGAVYVGAKTATLPTSTSAALTGLDSLGYCSDAGLTNDNTINSTDITAWGGDIVLSTETSKTDTFSFTLIEVLNEKVLAEVYGADNVSGSLSAGITVEANSEAHKARAWVFDMVMTGDVAKRIVVPNGKVTSVGTITYSDGAAVGYSVTVSAYPDSSGNTHYEYIKG